MAVSLLPINTINNAEVAVLGRLIRIFRVLRMVSIIPELRMRYEGDCDDHLVRWVLPERVNYWD
ncbi:MAG: hypothetical protein CR991_10640 [Proteobacteria bacterium]|nr:MAG: hypothetical protein CR991_10640 [Pseudomonadota bacterium]